VLDGVDLTVPPGEVVAVGGRSGSGKTTLLTIVGGFEPPDEGTVVVRAPGGYLAPPPWRAVALLPQALGLLDELSLGENVQLPGRLDADRAVLPAEELMDRLGVLHLADRAIDEVSLGEQQRAALARAAVVRPAVLLADEPFSHQNESWAEAMVLVIRLLADAGTACLVASHDRLAAEAADRALELRAGRLVERSPSEPPDLGHLDARPS
jgi:putative ABC transport system ATP-binding protein